MDRLLTRAEAARLLNKPTSWLRWCERERRIPFVKVGQHIRYRETDIEAWVRARRVPANPKAG
jgi:excisionase family DNA binding protein